MKSRNQSLEWMLGAFFPVWRIVTYHIHPEFMFCFFFFEHCSNKWNDFLFSHLLMSELNFSFNVSVVSWSAPTPILMLLLFKMSIANGTVVIKPLIFNDNNQFSYHLNSWRIFYKTKIDWEDAIFVGFFFSLHLAVVNPVSFKITKHVNCCRWRWPILAFSTILSGEYNFFDSSCVSSHGIRDRVDIRIEIVYSYLRIGSENRSLLAYQPKMWWSRNMVCSSKYQRVIENISEIFGEQMLRIGCR